MKANLFIVTPVFNLLSSIDSVFFYFFICYNSRFLWSSKPDEKLLKRTKYEEYFITISMLWHLVCENMTLKTTAIAFQLLRIKTEEISNKFCNFSKKEV